jgi:hypothetical protein
MKGPAARPLTRRTLLRGLAPAAVLTLVACEAAPNSASIDAAATATAAPPPPAPRAPALALPVDPVPQGGVFMAVIDGDGITGASVDFSGRGVPAVRDGGGWLAVVPTGQIVGLTEQLAAGVYPVRATVETGVGPTRLEGSVRVTATDFPVERITLPPSSSALLDPALIEREVALLRTAYGSVTPERLWDGFFLRPAAGEITDVYGSRRSFNGGPVSGSHSGVDFGAPTGTPVTAAAGGRVVLAQMTPVRGNMVILDHGAGVLTGYCHRSTWRWVNWSPQGFASARSAPPGW